MTILIETVNLSFLDGDVLAPLLIVHVCFSVFVLLEYVLMILTSTVEIKFFTFSC